LVPARRFDNDAAGGYAAKAAREVGDVLGDGAPHVLDGLHSLKFDLDRGFHEAPLSVSVFNTSDIFVSAPNLP
jgi:hypothetical protein